MKINYSYDEAALALGIGVDFLQKNIRDFPHRGYGTRVLFSEADLAEINEMFAVRPNERQQQERPAKTAARPAHKPARTATPKAANPLLDLKPRGASKKSA